MKKSWLVALIVLPLAVMGWMRLRLETDILATLPGQIPEVRALKLLRDGFAGGSDLVRIGNFEMPREVAVRKQHDERQALLRQYRQ